MKTVRKADVRYNGAIWHVYMIIDHEVDQHWTDVEIQYARADHGAPSVMLPVQIGDDTIREVQKVCFKELVK